MIEQKDQKAYTDKVALFQAMAQLDSKKEEIKSSQKYVKAYIISFLLPPLGIYYFVKYTLLAGGEGKNIRPGIISLMLTAVSFFLSFWLMANFIKQSTSSVNLNSHQILEDLMIPENQKELLQLFK